MSSAGRPAVLDRPAGETAGAARRPPDQAAGGPLWMRAVPPAATFALMLWRITTPSYWRDEGATLEAVRRPFGALIRMLGHTDAVHGAYYMIIWVVVRLGGSGEFITRLPSALAMAAAAAGVAGIGRRLVSPRAGLFAGLIRAHGDNIRMADAIVAAARRPGDAVLYASTGARNMAAAYPDGLAALRNIALDRAPIPSGTLAGTYLPALAVRRRLAAVRRVWVVEVSREAGPQRLPLLLGLRFRIVRKWHVSDIWLMLYRHRHRHSHHHPYQRQPPYLRLAAPATGCAGPATGRRPPLPGRRPRYRAGGGFGAGRYWQSIARRLPAWVNRSPLEH